MNSIQTISAKAKPYLERIENLIDDRETERGESMARCQAIAADIKEALHAEAKAGWHPDRARSSAIVKCRSLQKRIEALPAGLDIDEQSQYDALAAAFAGTPLGEHFQERADEVRNDATERPDEEHLQQIGRGRKSRKNGGVAIDLAL